MSAEPKFTFLAGKEKFLKGKTVVISGGSRGIGRAIAVRIAEDGANVAILAKTAEPHPKLPGTIYTVAKEIEEMGGKALPILCDIRKDDQVEEAIKKVVDKFGGIDIVINNASAINLTDTLNLSMKSYDLMHQINVRGTFAVSRAALPHLLNSPNPHILNMSPPLDMQSKWFGHHTAYTMSKLGMSMVAMGLAHEYKDQRVAVNTLWPETVISTAALQAFTKGDQLTELHNTSRTAAIMADATYAIICQPSKVFSGVAAIDSAILRKQGIADMGRYQPNAKATPALDLFVDGDTLSKFPLPPMKQVLQIPSKM